MKIKTILFQHRRDFKVIYECEHCGHEAEGVGYDDTFFHQNIIPKKVCSECGEKAGENYRPLTPKYPDYVSV